MNILITGGAGYIGSITNNLLQQSGHHTVVFDNLQNGCRSAIGKTDFIWGDLKNKSDIENAFQMYRYDAVIHFAALALARESMEQPYRYYENNILGGINLLEFMNRYHCRNIVFSSTCAVYGYPNKLPVTENESYKPVSVYGSSKRMFEEIIEWYTKIHKINAAILRYFNAAGALPDGSLGEDHRPESHIIPILIKTALSGGQFNLFGADYQTPDGTCVRDYIHVLDLARAHLEALGYLMEKNMSVTVNLGIGHGYSNLEVLRTTEKVTGKKIPYKVVARRRGDPDSIYADNTKAKQILNWKPEFKTLESIIKTAYIWHKNHPKGFDNDKT
ncbi:UDP-glucose 4-epimerase GalE [Candidatus Gottesmanbacteria bacterium RBG_16_43_7]|uniref:UDP-glucose 4-epimerase n=1 Tax=Candidatus Gottesmanbacteria bacterium RBG_16_43_7 TaxID=1798373 RepID=A0A1F5ZCT8_9BACT|nr:MAG: UDP-glucose 4-epimerase GalE [Candidatus Gottesmanbacteria bacterium RBG_16_43_7]